MVRNTENLPEVIYLQHAFPSSGLDLRGIMYVGICSDDIPFFQWDYRRQLLHYATLLLSRGYLIALRFQKNNGPPAASDKSLAKAFHQISAKEATL